MKKSMNYNGYAGSIEYCSDSKVFHGKILGIKSSITFEADSLKKLPIAFHESVEDYLKTCKVLGLETEGSFSSASKQIKPGIGRSQLPPSRA